MNNRFINFSAKEGLTDKFAYCATQDKQGYMWFATPSGLYRYDGHQFRIFRSPLDKPGRAISNILQTIYTANNGTLWLGGFNTLQWYDPKKNKFWGPAYDHPEVATLCNAYILNFTQEETGQIWIATSNNYFYRFNQQDSSFTNFGKTYPAGASKACIKIIIANNAVWALHNEGIYQFTPDNRFAGFYPLNGLSNGWQAQDTVFLSTYNQGIVSFSVADKKFKSDYTCNKTLQNNNLFCLIQDEMKNTWIGSYPLFRVSAKNELSSINNSIQSEYDLTASKIGSLFMDREKNLWICGYTGLSMMPWQNQQIKQLVLKEKQNGASIEPVNLYAIPQTNDIIFGSTNATGLLYYDGNKKELLTIENNLAKTDTEKPILGIVPCINGDIYVSDDNHFFKFLQKEKKLVPFPLIDQEGKPIRNVTRNLFSKNGIVYIGSVNNGFYSWDPGSNKLIHYNRKDADPALPENADNILYPSLADRENTIWFTSTNGVYSLNTQTQTFSHHAYKAYKDIPLLGTSNFITQDKAGHYWVTTNNNGLYELYFESGTEIVKNYTQNSNIGLPSDYLIKIKPDLNDSTLWISFNAGLMKFDPIHKRVLTILKKQNGLFADEGGYTFTITPNNLLLQLHYGNLNEIDLNTYRFNKTAPVVVYNSIKVFDKEKVYTINEEDPVLQLSANENFLQFEFTALQFNNSNQVQYAYMLENADKDWVYAGNRNSVSYSGLAPGTYIFKVKAAGNDGVWSEKESSIRIRIAKPVYLRWWFILLCILGMAALIYGWNRFKIQQVKKEEKLKTSFQQQIAATEMKALRAQMNPHFIFNSLNSIQKYILGNDQFAASQYLTKFSRLIRLILDHSNQNNILLSSELELLNLYIEMEGLRFDQKFSYSIEVANDIPVETIEIPSMLIQPFVENSIWHGLLHKEEKGTLVLRFSKTDNSNLQVVIEDNGIGREKAGILKSKQVLKKKSYGMQITEDRIAILNQGQQVKATCLIEDMKDANGNGTGTRVVLTFPIKS